MTKAERTGPTRRSVLTGAAAGTLAILPGLRTAHGAPSTLDAITWGGPFINATKDASAGFSQADITWDLHSGGAGTVLSKIKAAWPEPRYDLVAAWNPIFITMLNEGWLEPLTFEEVPNLRDVPDQFFYRDKDKQIVNAPFSLAGMFWAYREDTAPMKITKIEQLLDPKLKGQICWSGPNVNSNLQILSLAVANGGDENNMEPGWAFLERLAKSGNIGRVANNDTDLLNSMTTGETSIAFWNMSPFKTMSKDFKINILTRVPNEPGMKAFMYHDGWVLLRSSKNKQAAKDYINYFVKPDINQRFNELIGQGPANTKSKADGFAMHVSFTPDELKEYAYFPNFAVLAGLQDASLARFQTSILPLLR